MCKKSKHLNKKSTEQRLNKLQNDFKVWRKSRRNQKEAIPEVLWGKALKLLKYYSLGKISSSLSLNHQKLKSKSQENTVPAQSTTNSKSEFIEVNVANKPGTKNCLIELENAKGEHFKIHVNHETALKHIDFIKSFLTK